MHHIVRVFVYNNAQAGACTETKNNAGQTALIAAAREGQLDALHSLLHGGAAANATDKDGATSLRTAACKVGLQCI
jgi:ankyrin repeat protein